MIRPKLSALFIAALVLLVGAPSHAEDETAGSGAQDPSPVASMNDDDLAAPTDPADPFSYLESFRDWLKKHEIPPPKTKNDTALYQIWKAALYPRAARMRRRIDKLLKRKHWLPEGGTPERVKPASWSRFIREMAGLTTELTGAWNQYQRARIRIKRGIPRERVRPLGSYYGYAESAGVWRRGLLARGRVVQRRVGVAGGVVVGGSTTVGGVRIGGSIRVGARLSPVVLHSYWNLMNRYRAGWRWRIRHCVDCEQRRTEEQKKKLEDYIAERQRVFDTTRDTLEQQILSLRLLAAAMQAQEEHYLGDDLAVLGRSEEMLEANEKVLLDLARARLEAEQYSGESSAAYGQLLRGWTRNYNKAIKRLEKAAKEARREG